MEVLIFKSVSDEDSLSSDKYFTELKASDYSPTIVPTLTFAFCNLDVLGDKLGRLSEYDGIVFSSPRCVEALWKCTNFDDFQTLWAGKKVYAVGNVTREALLAKNSSSVSIDVIIGDEENAASMATKIQETLLPAKGKILYPCGNLRRDVLQSTLQQHSITVDPVTCYETIEHPQLKNALCHDTLQDKLRNGLCALVFFSPSGVNFVSKYISAETMKGQILIALGPTTLEALKAMGTDDESHLYVCSKPSPSALLEVLHSLKVG